MFGKRSILHICAATALAVSLPAAGGAKDNNRHFLKESGAQVHKIQGCPPGLAKKNPPCIPPGQAKKLGGYDRYDDDRYYDRVRDDNHDRRDDDRYVYHDRYDTYYDYRIGEYVRDNYIIVDAPGRYGLDPNRTYYNVNNQIYQVDRDTQQVLAIIGLAQRILN